VTEKALKGASKVELRNPQRGKYFRIISKVWIDGESLADMLKAKGLALRSASVAPRAGSALLGGSLRLTPLLAGRSETEAEAQEEDAVGGLAPEPIRGTGVDRRVEPGTTARDAAGAIRRPDRIAHCAAPKSCDYNYICTTDFNPKTVAILETIYKHISKGEQVIHVSARHGMTDEIEKRLGECGVKTSRIDGSVKDHALEAAKFKRGDTQVLLMGINCAQAHSFEQCRNLIVGSLEWSYGKFSQALGRIYRLTSPQDVNVYVILHKNSIEELMFDKLGTKEDAATICLHGKRVPRDVNMVDAQEILAEHVTGWESLDKGIEVYEADNEEMWPQLRDRFLTITHGKKLGITKTEQDAVSALIEEMNDYETA
jgi:hypothetical protein